MWGLIYQKSWGCRAEEDIIGCHRRNNATSREDLILRVFLPFPGYKRHHIPGLF